MIPDDTSPKIRDMYFRQLAKMTPAERVRIGVALWTAGDSLQRAVARRKYPEADEAEINFKIAVSRFGEKLARAAYRKS